MKRPNDGLSAEEIKSWEEQRKLILPASLKKIYEKQNGGALLGTSVYLNPLHEIVSLPDYYRECDSDMMDYLDDSEELTASEISNLLTLGDNDNFDSPLFLHLGSEPARLFYVFDCDLEQVSDNLESFFTELTSFEESPTFVWEDYQRLQLLASGNLPSSHLENHLGRDEQGGVVLFTRTAEDGEEVLTKTTFTSFEPEICSIQPYPVGFALFLSGESKDETCKRTELGWKNEKAQDLGGCLILQDREKLLQIRQELLGEKEHQRLLEQEQAQAEMISKLSGMTGAEGEAAGAAMGATVMAEMLKMMEDDDDDEDDDPEMAEMMSGLMASMQTLASDLQQKADAGLAPDAAAELQELMKKNMGDL